MSSRHVELTSSDGVKLDAYVAEPTGDVKGAVIVIQEIFGVNSHIRSVADRFAKEGFFAVAPALFDRIQPNVELGYEAEDMSQALSLLKHLDIPKALADTQAAIDFAKSEGFDKISIVGFCFGGSIAWIAASRANDLAATVGYYGGMVPDYIDDIPAVPTMLHFGEYDDHIPMEGVNKVAKAHPEVDVFTYEAGHGFNCDQRASFDEKASKEAWQRTLSLLTKASS